MRIIIDMGHTPTSPGASGYLDELYCDRQVGKRIIAELERRGHTVFDSTAPDYMAYPDEVNYRVQYEHDTPNIDLFCSIHLNAGGGEGCEVLYYDGDSTGYEYADQISKNTSEAIGIYNRGPKPNDWVGVICNTWCTAVLIEYCFVAEIIPIGMERATANTMPQKESSIVAGKRAIISENTERPDL